VLSDPLVQSAGLPLGLAFVLAGLLRLVGGPGRGNRLAGVACGLGFLAAYWAIRGLPPLPPVAAAQKLFWAAALGLAAGLALDLAGSRPRPVAAAAALAAAGTAAWLGWARLQQLPADWLAALTVAAVAVFAWRVAATAADRGTEGGLQAGLMLLAAALGLGAIALTASSASLAQAAFALAAALGGFLLWNWPVPRFPAGAALLLGGLAALAGLLAQAALFTRGQPAVLLPLLLVAFADLPARRFAAGGGTLRIAWRGLALALFALLPAMLAAGLAWWLNGPIWAG